MGSNAKAVLKTASIVMTESAALAAAGLLMETHRGDVMRAFPSFFRRDIFEKEIREARERTAQAECAAEAHIRHMRGLFAEPERVPAGIFPVREGGVYAALWELGEALESGLCAELREIPVRQETIEICEMFGVDPYGADSTGALLVAAPEGAVLAEELRGAGVPAAVIGRLVSGRARTVVCGERVRYLEKT